MLTPNQYERYNRQLLLPQLGEAGQQKLLAASVLVVGAGGLGCPVLQYLVAAGVGRIGIVDDDVVALSNLHRQILFGTSDVGKSKAVVAAHKLQLLNDGVQVNVYNHRLTTANAWDIIKAYDLVVDGSDNFATRYMVNDACVLLGKPLVYGSIYRFEGQVAVFNCNSHVNYRHLHPVQPPENEIPNCAEAGVIGVLPGIIGSLMANEAIKIIAGIGNILCGKLFTYHSLQNHSYIFDLNADIKADGTPTNRLLFEAVDYGDGCAAIGEPPTILSAELNRYLAAINTLVADVREPGEQPLITEFEHIQIPLSGLRQKVANLSAATIVVVCQTGVRSVEAARLLKAANPASTILILKGGITAWKKIYPLATK